jgi:hypothetical protein
MKRASFVHGKAKVQELERAARALLDIPALPDGATGPGSRALLAEIREHERLHGKAAALKAYASCSTVTYACALDTDDAETKAASKRTVAHLEHPTKKGEYHFPDCARLQQALANPTARAKCSAAALAALDDHAAKAGPLSEDWSPKP